MAAHANGDSRVGSPATLTTKDVVVRPLVPQEEAAAEELLDAEIGGRSQVRLEEVHDVLGLPGFAAWHGSRMGGVATYAGGGPRVELAVLAVAADWRGRGIGGLLVEAVASAVAAEGARELWLVTTNDNLEALRLYQRHQFRLAELRANAVDRARRIKATIPLIGCHGIPIHDELVLVRRLD